MGMYNLKKSSCAFIFHTFQTKILKRNKKVNKKLKNPQKKHKISILPLIFLNLFMCYTNSFFLVLEKEKTNNKK